MNIIYRIVGLLLLTFFAFSDIVAFPIKLIGFIIVYIAISGIEIGAVKKYWYAQGRKESVLLSANLDDLQPEYYYFSGPAVQRMSDSFMGTYRSYYVWLEYGEGMTPIEINESDGDRLEKIMGKPISQIKAGEVFKINKNRSIT